MDARSRRNGFKILCYMPRFSDKIGAMYLKKALASWQVDANFLNLTLFLFSLFSFFCAAFYTFHPRYELDGYALYALLAIALATCAAGASLFAKKNEVRGEPFPEKAILYSLIIFFIALGFGLYRIDVFSIWLDEEIQADATKGIASIARGASFTQMPLSYYFTALNISWLGLNEWGLRVIPCLFYAASCSLFSLLIKALCSSRAIQLLAPIIFLLNPWMIHYAQEGRPYALLIFCGVLWLHMVRNFLTSDYEQDLARNALALFSSTLFFFLSIAFQPIVLAISVLPVLALAARKAAWFKKTAVFGSVTLASILLAAPLVHLSRISSITYLQPALNWRAISPSTISLSGFFLLVDELFRFPGIIWALAAAIILVFAGKKWLRGEAMSPKEEVLLFCLSACVCFATFFWALFFLLVRYDLHTRYFMIAYPLGLVTICVSLDYAITRLPENLGVKGLKLALQAGLPLLLMLSEIRDIPFVYNSTAFDRLNDNHRSMYEYLKLAGREGDVAYFLPVQSPYIDWEQTGFTVSQFYYADGSPVALANHWKVPAKTTTADLILKDLREKKPGQIFIIYPDTRWVRSLFNTGPVQLNSFLIHRVKVNGSMSEALTAYFSKVVNEAPDKETIFRIYDILLHLAEFDGDAARCGSYLKEMAQIKSSAVKLVEIYRYHQSRCSDIQPRPKAMSGRSIQR